ncbi:hypothetical protein EYR41_004594 [Orbilia oligospora]|uniref:Uncharacterized protein n=1 Tax=Orbilia oligospora TaxID=2813651 RepID=A0A7C8KNP8_ORBOL|nr:hypothetical protein TWF751_005274 [Orbilia oligospora]TGJ72719.1 hypothetical protein EYR41_004594 [Orbilia oligospora]
MMRQSRPDVIDLIPQARSRSRSLSMSSDTAISVFGGSSSTPAPLTGVLPEAAYIATSAATQIVTSDHESFFQTLCAEGIVKPGPPTILVTPDALRLVNQFLDYLLWSILLVGKSTMLRSLRPAVTEVLKSRLAREAIASAEAELEEYLGDGDGDDLEDGLSEGDEFDVERIWKKARLRCMIYSSLGDLEEDDDEGYEESEYSLNGIDQYARNGPPTAVSPAVAIFLTSILEFIGEQTLLVAGHATVARFSQARIAAAAEEGTNGSYEAVDRPSVEELDMEKVALNPVLGRMWRQWKKLLRGPSAGGQIASRAPSIRRDSRRQSTISTVSIQSVLESRSDSGAASPCTRDLTTKKSDDGISPVEEHMPPVIKSGLRKLASAEMLGSAPLTPIPETPSNTDGGNGAKMVIPDMAAMKHEVISGIPDFPRPNSMTTFPSHSSTFVFPFSKAQPKEVNVAIGEEEVIERTSYRRARSNSLPLPGSFPFSPEDVDFPLSPISPLSPLSPMSLRPHGEEEEEEAITPVPERPPHQFPDPVSKEQDLESIAETDEDATDIDDEAGEVSTLDSFVIHETAEATATTPTFYRAQSVRIISTGSAPVGFEITERKSSSTISTLREKEEPNESRDSAQRESPVDRSLHSPDEIGVARTSDIALPTPISSPIIGTNRDSQIAEQSGLLVVRRPSADSSAESATSATRDIAKERRRRSKYYQPAPAPSAPDFYPEHHTEDEIVEYEKQKDDEPEKQPTLQISQVLHINDEPSVFNARKSAREELLELYSHDPEFDEDDEPEPVKRQTKPVRSLRGASPFGSPDLSQTAKSTHSNSSESLTGRSHSSGALSADRRQYPSFDLARPSSNRDVSTPTSSERAGVRVWTPPATPDAAKGGRFKATLNKTKGHAHSASASSQTSAKLKGFIGGRPTTADDKRQVNSRQDWDNESSYSDTHASKIDEKERSFEQLINSGATLQYTLTPDNVKRIDLEIASSRKGSGDSGRTKASVDKYVPIVTPVTQSPQPGRSSSQKSRPLTTIASEEYEYDDIVPDIPSKQTRLAGVSSANDNITFFPPRSTSTSFGMMPQPPRGASLQAINTQPNTGITAGQAPLSPLESPRSPATRSPLIPRRPTASSIDEIRSLRSASSRGKLVARAPQPATADSTLALIDFFRNTPPPLDAPVNPPLGRSSSVSSRTPSVSSRTPSISSRTPYRSAMDSKHSGPNATPQDSMTSIAEKSNSHSSFHSQADLIKKPEPPQPSPRVLQRPQTDGGPTRKQVRIKDPYAIDSDDEDDELFDRPAPRARQEESLMDFLMNAPPPEPTPVQPFVQQQPLKKKSSAAQLIGRFRSSSKSSKISKAIVSAPVESRMAPKFQQSASSGSSASLPARKHVPLPVKPVMEQQFPPRAQSSGGIATKGMMVSSPLPPMPRKPSIFQARDAKAYAPDSDSSGLADFLRYTGPPVNIEPAPAVSGEKFKSSGKKKRGIAV